jgi:hypothetical protein
VNWEKKKGVVDAQRKNPQRQPSKRKRGERKKKKKSFSFFAYFEEGLPLGKRHLSLPHAIHNPGHVLDFLQARADLLDRQDVLAPQEILHRVQALLDLA